MHISIENLLKNMESGELNREECEVLYNKMGEYLSMKKKETALEPPGTGLQAISKGLEIHQSPDKEDFFEILPGNFSTINFILPDESDLKLTQTEDYTYRFLFRSEEDENLRFAIKNEVLEVSCINGPDNISIEAELWSPAPVNIDIKGKHGDILCEGITGDFHTEGHSLDVMLDKFRGNNAHIITGDGDVDIIESEGAFHVRSTGGDVFMRDTGEKTDISSISGNVELRDVSGEINIFTRSGNIEGWNLEDKISLKSSSGDIEAKDLRGEIHLNTISGDIEAVDSLGTFTISSTSGDIECAGITVEKLEVESTSGNIELEIDVIEEGAEVNINTQSGTISMNLPEECDGAINAETTSGSIENKVKFHKLEMESEKSLTGILTDSSDYQLPSLGLKTKSGDILINNQ